MVGEVSAQLVLVERRDAYTEVVDVVTLRAWRRAAFLADRAVDVQEVDDEIAGPELVQPDLGMGLLDYAAEYRRVELQAFLEILNSKDDMVE